MKCILIRFLLIIILFLNIGNVSYALDHDLEEEIPEDSTTATEAQNGTIGDPAGSKDNRTSDAEEEAEVKSLNGQCKRAKRDSCGRRGKKHHKWKKRGGNHNKSLEENSDHKDGKHHHRKHKHGHCKRRCNKHEHKNENSHKHGNKTWHHTGRGRYKV